MKRHSFKLALPLLAFSAILLAVRLTAPLIIRDAAQMERWLAGALDVDVEIAEAGLSWRGWRPVARLGGVELRDPGNGTTLATLERVTVGLAPLTSAVAHRLAIRDITLHELRIEVVRETDGSISLMQSDVADSGPDFSASDLNPLLERSLTVRLADTAVTFVDARDADAEPLVFEHAAARIETGGGELEVTARAALPADLGTSFVLHLDASGNPLASGWNGDLSLTVTGLNVAAAAGFPALGAPAGLDGTADVRVWTRWQSGRLGRVRASGRLDGLHADSGAALSAPLGIEARIERAAEGWQARAALAPGPRDSGDGAPLKAHFVVGSAAPEPGAGARLTSAMIRGRNVDLGWFAELAAFAVDEPVRARLAELGPTGVADTLRLDFLRAPASGRAPEFRMQSDIESLTTRAAADVPAFEIGGFSLQGDETRIDFDFAPHTARVRHPQHLAADLELDIRSLSGTLSLAGAPELSIRAAEFEAAAIPIAVRGRLAPAAPEAEADLVFSIGAGPLSRIAELMPRGVMSENGDRWLRRAFQGGTITGGRGVLRGPLDAFPFAGLEGRFRATLSAEDAIVDYDPAWPRVEEARFTLDFDGALAEAEIESGKLLDADLRATRLALPDLNAENYVLSVSGIVDTAWETLVAFVRESPLSEGGAGELSEVDISDDVELTLDLAIPLETDDDTTLLGTLKLPGNDFVDEDLDIELTNLRGIIGFTREDWYGQDLRATFEEQEITLIVNGGLDDPNYDVEFTLSAVSPASYLFTKLEEYSPEIYAWLDREHRLSAIRGELDWEVTLTVPDTEGLGPDPATRVEFQSNLSGLGVDLPWPLRKVPEQTRPIRFVTYVDGYTDAVHEVEISDLISVDYTLDGERLTGALVRFGDVPEREFVRGEIRLYGELDVLPLSELQTFLPADRGARAPSAGVRLPVNADFSIQQLDLMGQTFSDVEIEAEQRDGDWQVEARGPDFDGTLFVTRGDAQRISLELNELRIAAPQSGGPPLSLDPRGIPEIDIVCENFVFGGRSLGRAEISTEPRDDGLTLNALTFRHPDFTVDAAGEWTVTAGRSRSRFDIDVTAPELGAMLATFGYETGAVSGGETLLKIDANWPGTPAEFELARLGGSLSLLVKDGSLRDLEPGGGRLFGLLSLQTLPRRLGLDFKDLFAEGLVFDRIEGDFALDQGNAYTNDLTLTGPSARIEVAGRIGLANKDYDQQVTVTPQLSNTFPVAGALFGPVGVGVGAAIYLGGKIFKEIPASVDKMFEKQYTITGEWKDPVVEQI